MPGLDYPRASHEYDLDELGRLSLAQLQELARELGIDYAARLRKSDLIQALTRVRELQALNVRQLRALAAERGVEGAGRLNKPELVRELAALEGKPEKVARAGDSDRGQKHTQALPFGLKLRHVIGWALSLTGVVGVVVSLLFSLSLPGAVRSASAGLQSTLHAVASQTRGVAASIQIATEALDQTSKTLQDSRQAIEGIDMALQDSEPLIESTGVLLRERLPETLEETRQALLSAQAGARAIDQVLRGLNSVRLITGVVYEPEQSLDQGLIAMADGLQPLPATLKRVEADLAAVGERFSEFQPVLRTASEDIEALSVDLLQVSADMRKKSESLEDLALLLETTAEGLPARVPLLTTVLIILAVWLALGQVGLTFVGEWVRRSARHPSVS